MDSEEYLREVRLLLPIDYDPLRGIIMEYLAFSRDEMLVYLKANQLELIETVEETNRNIEEFYAGHRRICGSRARKQLHDVLRIATGLRRDIQRASLLPHMSVDMRGGKR